MAHPIWKDYYVSLGTADSIEYRILCGNEVIYSGRSWKRPGEAENRIRINDICADYLVQGSANFRVQVWEVDKFLTEDSVQFINDWSYDYEYDVDIDGMAFPINGKVASNQRLTYSVLGTDEVTAKFVFESGLVQYYDFAAPLNSAGVGVAVVNLANYPNLKSIEIGNTNYEVVSQCSRYALYYMNAHGGWDSLLIEGNHSEVDNLTRHTREADYDNTSVQNRGTINVVNEISKSLTLHTSWMSDDQSSRMHHLLNSTDVYLYDFLTGEVIPVLLTNTTTEYKTYKSNGCKLVNYAISVKYANDRIRR